MRLVVVGVLACAVLVQPKPNFSGTWTLHSSTGSPQNGAAKPVVVVLTQNDTTLTLKNGDLTMVMPLDGSATTIKGPNGRDVRLRTKWDDTRLVVEQRSEATSILQTVSLSNDGNELTIDMVAQTPQGEAREKQTFRKFR